MQNKVTEEKWDYVIDGKQNRLAWIIIMSVISAFFIVLTVDQLKPEPNKNLMVALVFGGIAATTSVISGILIIRYFCFKIYIGKDGFFFQTNPFDGRYYKYSDIKNCNEELITSMHDTTSGARETVYHYYFTFTAKSGESKKVKFEKSVYEREINILKERIEKISPEEP